MMASSARPLSSTLVVYVQNGMNNLLVVNTLSLSVGCKPARSLVRCNRGLVHVGVAHAGDQFVAGFDGLFAHGAARCQCHHCRYHLRNISGDLVNQEERTLYPSAGPCYPYTTLHLITSWDHSTTIVAQRISFAILSSASQQWQIFWSALEAVRDRDEQLFAVCVSIGVDVFVGNCPLRLYICALMIDRNS